MKIKLGRFKIRLSTEKRKSTILTRYIFSASISCETDKFRQYKQWKNELKEIKEKEIK